MFARQICLGSVRQQELAVVLSNFALAHFNRILPCQLCLGSTAAGYALGFVSQPPGDSFQSHSTSSPFPGQHQVVGYVLDFVSHPPAHFNRISPRQSFLGSTRLLDMFWTSSVSPQLIVIEFSLVNFAWAVPGCWIQPHHHCMKIYLH
ncbi:hypothetical protein D9757_010672 [Collybiopsis confluens]|uniref:Uncharacterized protein n=1 Tax=Collybiopsis confluens TaxID=2823264 RepID=A0A8H5GM45_9AGAR|nr:hypothetical protein D9757_010672 [Collybiopsis confluens]